MARKGPVVSPWLWAILLGLGTVGAPLDHVRGAYNQLPTPQGLIAKVKQRYAQLSSYYDEGTMRLFYAAGSEELQRKDNFTSYYLKGQKFKIQGLKVGHWGKTTLYVLWGRPGCYAFYREDRDRGLLEYVDHRECMSLPNGFDTTWVGEVHGSAQAMIFPLFYSQIKHQFDTPQAHFEVVEEQNSYRLKSVVGQDFMETTTEYWIEKESYLIRHVQIRGQYYKTLIDYETVSVDQPLPDEVFAFVMPEYALAFSYSMRDQTEKQERLQKLAAEGMPEAQMALLGQGSGEPEHKIKALVEMASELAEQGYSPAQVFLAHLLMEGEPIMLPSPYTRLRFDELVGIGRQYLEKAALACDREALKSLVDGYFEGRPGFERSAQKARYWYEKKEKCRQELMPK